jgi:hypothetical protein
MNASTLPGYEQKFTDPAIFNIGLFGSRIGE